MLVGCGALYQDENLHTKAADVSVTPEVGEVPQRLELEQAWSNKTRMDFWFTSQGSQILPYSWFTWLEQADNQEYFRSVEHMESLRYLSMPSSPRNPAGLPIGFALNENKDSGDAWVGLTCSACHTNQIDYQGKKILVEGAPTLGNFVLFYSKLVAALNATNEDSEKFDRFAKKVLADDYSESAANNLHTQLTQLAIQATERENVNNLPSNYPRDFTSYGRLDAFGNIQNAGSAFALHDLTNNNAPTAPVSYPFLWGTHQSDVVQWNASAPNTPVVGPLVRNIGEVVGVFGSLSIEEASWWKRMIGIKNSYSSTVDMKGLGKLESWVKELRSPAWPQQYLPAINSAKAAGGAALYQKECASCHQVIPRGDEGNKYKSVKTPVTVVGTDPATAWNADFHMADTLLLEGTKSKIVAGDKFDQTAAAISISVNGVVGLVLKDPIKALEAGLIPINAKPDKAASEASDEANASDKSLEEYMAQNVSERENIRKSKKAMKPKGRAKTMASSQYEGLVYKARPLNGIWATAPFLHNGSVPNLWELLQKPEKRSKQFWVGNREFDPVNVGFVTDNGLSEFKVMSEDGHIQKGNSNQGHIYGTQLTENQKWKLIEYMKTL
jgi:cytochrome c5